MVVLNKIYTRTGDKGDTALSDGSRVAKHDPRVEAYGTVDELNATLGLCRLHATGDLAEWLAVIQNDLFDLGADLSRPNMAADDQAGYPVLRIIDAQVTRLESEIDAMNADLQPLRSFILPGARRSRPICICRAPSPAGPSVARPNWRPAGMQIPPPSAI